MAPNLLLLSCGRPSRELQLVQGFADFAGVQTRCVDSSEIKNVGELGSHLANVVIDVASFSDEALNRLSEFCLSSDGQCQHVFFLIRHSPPTTPERLLNLAGYRFHLDHGQAEAASIRFPIESEAYARELVGQTFPMRKSPVIGLTSTGETRSKVIMSIGSTPTFLGWSTASSNYFAWVTRTVLDLDAHPIKELDLELCLDTFIPLLIFFQAAFGDSRWHSPHRLAGCIIDDPLLAPRYGLLDFRQLLTSAEGHDFHVSLAFIPWNEHRTRKKDAALFKRHARCFSLCVHGCDHTDQEFGHTDYDLLLDKTRVALERMDRHSGRVGIPYAPIMVCPQEQCSLEAWKAFADSPSLLGMVNTGCLPRNVPNRRVRSADLLLPAQDALFGFPVFKRHYPGDFSRFALALFLGQPAILVEHHDYFRHGLEPLETHVRKLKETCPAIQWVPLEELATTTHLRRHTSTKVMEVRFFTRKFRLSPNGVGGTSLRFYKRIHDPSAVRSVTVNGVTVAHEFNDPFVVFETTAKATYPLDVEVNLTLPEPRRVYSFGLAHQCRVGLRRFLCEFRDQHVARYPRSQRWAAWLSKRIRSHRKLVSTQS